MNIFHQGNRPKSIQSKQFLKSGSFESKISTLRVAVHFAQSSFCFVSFSYHTILGAEQTGRDAEAYIYLYWVLNKREGTFINSGKLILTPFFQHQILSYALQMKAHAQTIQVVSTWAYKWTDADMIISGPMTQTRQKNPAVAILCLKFGPWKGGS